MKISFLSAIAVAATLLVTACSSASEDDASSVGETNENLTPGGSFTSHGTGYYPAKNQLEGGFVDRRGKALKTLQQYLAGNADYVSVAMDSNAFSYGQRLRINELEKKYGRPITFRVVDTGGAFRGKGKTRIDICTASSKASLDPTINGSLHIDVMNESAGSAPVTPPAPADDDSEPAKPGGDDAPPPSSGIACKSHGDCNTGTDGSGMICVSGHCVEGCTASWQCPGSTTCSGGHCR